MLRRIAVALTLSLVPAALPVLATEAAAQPAKAGPGTAAVKQANDTIAGLIKKKAPATDVQKSVRTILDIDALGKAAMTNQWSKLKPNEQTDFLKVLRDLIEANYVNIQKANAEYTTEYTGESTNKDGNVVVNTKVSAQRKGRPFTMTIDYVLVKNGASLQIFDVVTDGVGLVENYRQMFDKLMRDKGFAGLMDKMKAKLAEIQKASGVAKT
jgi:phospholipid transport system substrate-binding protein